MAYWQMDDQFMGNHKTRRALRKGSEALQMWCALRTYVAVNTTDGEVPDEDIDDLPHAPKNPRKWLMVLVNCGKPLGGGRRGAGLVDKDGDSWKLHDFEHHGLSASEVERRKEAARERKRLWRERQREMQGNAGRHAGQDGDVTRGQGGTGTQDATRDERPPIPHPIPHPTPGKEEPPNPPPNKTPPDRFARSFQSLRPDVLELHADWRREFDFPEHKLSGPTDRNAEDLADAIDAHGLEACRTMLRVAKFDGMVNGTADKGQKHEQIRYIFGNPDTRARLLRLAKQRERPTGTLPALEAARRARELEPDEEAV